MGDVLLVTGDPATARAVAHSAPFATAPERLVQCGQPAQLRERLEAHRPAVALVDVDPQPLAMLSRLDGIVRAFPDVRFVILCAAFAQDVVIEAMQLGVRHCLVKDRIDAELPGVLRRFLDDDRRATRGPVVTLLSASGGSGATTLAVNLAEEWRREHRADALVVDLDVDYGAVASYLGVEPRYGVADLLDADAIDAELVRSIAAERAGLHVLASPVSIDPVAPRTLRLERLDDVLDACSRAFAFTTVDAPRLPPETAARLASRSTLTLVVFELTVVDVRRARTILDVLGRRGVSLETVLPVANRYRRRGGLVPLPDVVDALGGVEVATIGNDFADTIRSLNLGRPIAEVAPRSSLRKDLRALLDAIATRTGQGVA